MSDKFEGMSRTEIAQSKAKTLVKRLVYAATLVLLFFVVGLGSFFTTDAGKIYTVQDTVFGSLRVITKPGVHLKVPLGFTIIEEYKQVATIGTVAKGEKNPPKFTRNMPLVNVQFADTYTGNIPVTFRFKLPLDPKKIRHMHNEFRSFDNLVDSLLVRNAKNVTVVTATQYTGEEFFQGGVNSYKTRLEDQLRNGLYETQREQVLQKTTGMAAVSSEQSDGNKQEEQTRLVWKNVIQEGANGQKLRLANPLALYGVTVTQVTIDKPEPDARLETLLDEKRKLVGKRISAVQQIETAKAEARAAQQTVEIEKRREIQIAQKVKDLAVIAGQKLVEVEQQQARLELVKQQKEKDVAIIQKKKEQEIALANRGIQKANADAAIFQAKAVLEVGLATAKVEAAKLKAKQDSGPVYMAELQRDISLAMYRALPGIKIEMPRNYVNQGGGKTAGSSMTSNLDILGTFGALASMDNLGKKSAQDGPRVK